MLEEEDLPVKHTLKYFVKHVRNIRESLLAVKKSQLAPNKKFNIFDSRLVLYNMGQNSFNIMTKLRQASGLDVMSLPVEHVSHGRNHKTRGCMEPLYNTY